MFYLEKEKIEFLILFPGTFYLRETPLPDNYTWERFSTYAAWEFQVEVSGSYVVLEIHF